MRKIFFFLLFPIITYPQTNLPYKSGEHLFFDISFSGISVGTAELEVKGLKKINGTALLHVVGTGKTSSFFDLVFKVRDTYQTYIDTQYVRPNRFIRDIYEGGYEKKQLYNFNHQDSIVFFDDTSHVIQPNTQDMLSALFFARTFSKKNLKKNKSFFVPIFMDEENYFLEIIYLHNEKLETKLGDINCMVFKPKMQEGRVFEDGDKIKIWISDDQNHLLVKVEAKIWAGNITAKLRSAKKLKHPLLISR